MWSSAQIFQLSGNDNWQDIVLYDHLIEPIAIVSQVPLANYSSSPFPLLITPRIEHNILYVLNRESILMQINERQSNWVQLFIFIAIYVPWLCVIWTDNHSVIPLKDLWLTAFLCPAPAIAFSWKLMG